MSKAIGLDKERERELAAAKAAEAAEMEMAVAADKSALQGEPTRSKSEPTEVDHHLPTCFVLTHHLLLFSSEPR